MRAQELLQVMFLTLNHHGRMREKGFVEHSYVAHYGKIFPFSFTHQVGFCTSITERERKKKKNVVTPGESVVQYCF